MPLKLTKRKGTGIWRIRGTVQGRRVDQSAKTRSRTEARKIATRIQSDITREAFTERKPKGHTFADAATSYLESGRGKPYDMEKVIILLNETPLADITQGMVDRLALKGWPDAKVSTRVRKFYAPVSAVLTYAQGERMMTAFRVKSPRIEKTATEWRTPEEAEIIINSMGDIAPLVTFLFGTGCRISEACRLQWKDVSPDGRSVTFWITKSVSRSIQLCKRTRASLPERQGRSEYVWQNGRGHPWSADARGAFSGPRQRMIKRCELAGIPPISPHDCRHSWASWTYAMTRDTLSLMVSGGWGSLGLVQRYTHLGTDDLAEQVKLFGWQDFGQYLGNKAEGSHR